MTLSRQDKTRLQQAKQVARKRVVKRGIVEFRADEELMDQLLQLSDQKKTPVGTLVRQWIVPIVRAEFANSSYKKARLGKHLSQADYSQPKTIFGNIERRLRALEKRISK